MLRSAPAELPVPHSALTPSSVHLYVNGAPQPHAETANDCQPTEAMTTAWNGTMPPPVTGKVPWQPGALPLIRPHGQESVVILPSWMVITPCPQA